MTSAKKGFVHAGRFRRKKFLTTSFLFPLSETRAFCHVLYCDSSFFLFFVLWMDVTDIAEERAKQSFLFGREVIRRFECASTLLEEKGGRKGGGGAE